MSSELRKYGSTSVVQTSNIGFTSEVSDYLVVHMGPGLSNSSRTSLPPEHRGRWASTRVQANERKQRTVRGYSKLEGRNMRWRVTQSRKSKTETRKLFDTGGTSCSVDRLNRTGFGKDDPVGVLLSPGKLRCCCLRVSFTSCFATEMYVGIIYRYCIRILYKYCLPVRCTIVATA